MELFITSFVQVPDPLASNARHDFVETLCIAFVAVLCGAKSYVDMADVGWAKATFFEKVLGLAQGIPSHDTFSTVFRMLNPLRQARQKLPRWRHPGRHRRLVAQLSPDPSTTVADI